MAHPVVHWEIGARDPGKLQDFFRRLFDWHIDTTNPMSYGMVQTGSENGINGGIGAAEGNVPPCVTFYVQVDDLQAYLDKAERLGGKTLVPPSPIPGIGAFAMFNDPEGNCIGLFKS